MPQAPVMPEPIGWGGVGVVGEVRGLGTKADKNNIWAYSVKIIGFGNTVEAQTRDKALADTLAEGMQVRVSGTFEVRNGGVQLILKDATDLNAKAA